MKRRRRYAAMGRARRSKAVAADTRVAEYQPYWAARADLPARAGERDEALFAYERALGLTVGPAVRRYLASRAARLAHPVAEIAR